MTTAGGRGVAVTAMALAAAAVVMFAGPARAGDEERTHKGTAKSAHFEIRYRPGSRAAASVDRVAAMAERDFDRIVAALRVEPAGTFTLWLYDDLAELRAITKTEGNAGYSAGRASHLPYDNDQTRFHEMVHIVAAATIPKTGEEPRSLFFAEGLANALLEFVDGVPVHAVAAFDRKRKSLPALAEMAHAPDFYAFLQKDPRRRTYDLAASWIRFLIDTRGVEKVKAYYGGLPAKEAFGASEADLEKAWHAALDAYPLRPETEVLLRRQRGEPASFEEYAVDPNSRIPPEILGKPQEWKPLGAATLKPDDPARWTRRGEAIEGRSADANWATCLLGATECRDVAFRARVRPAPGCVGVQLRLGPRCQGMLTNAGTFLWKDAPVAASNADPIGGRAEVDFLLVRRGDRVEVWLDGFKVVEGRAADDPCVPGIGVAGGTATFEAIRFRPLR